ncbi:MAG: serine hydrolase [Acidobacteriota bacterium]|jgi:CubicO group peptidase (beta-lactamase class C family)|nr:MAG: 6-aminohexanoate hydrolase [Acidobacteriota bacterium]
MSVQVWRGVGVAAVLLGLSAGSSCGRSTDAAAPGSPQQGDIVLPAPPVPVSALDFGPVISRAATLPRLYSLLVSVDGQLIAEAYFNGASASRATNIKSASKSIISTLVGVAIEQGYIAGVHEPIGPYFPEYLRDDPARSAITIEDLVTMRAGLESTSSRNYGRWVQSGNWVRYILERPFVDEPGGRMIYSTGSTHLLSAILTRATGMSTLAFARRALGEPLGIRFEAWTRDPQGIYLGGNEMAMRPRDLLRIGELYLEEGRHDGRQIVPREWVRASLEPRTTSRFGDREYGYGWWIRRLDGYDTFYAWGYGGQFAFIVPALRTVVVATSDSTPNSERRDHLRAVYALVGDGILPEAARAFPSQPKVSADAQD